MARGSTLLDNDQSLSASFNTQDSNDLDRIYKSTTLPAGYLQPYIRVAMPTIAFEASKILTCPRAAGPDVAFDVLATAPSHLEATCWLHHGRVCSSQPSLPTKTFAAPMAASGKAINGATRPRATQQARSVHCSTHCPLTACTETTCAHVLPVSTSNPYSSALAVVVSQFTRSP